MTTSRISMTTEAPRVAPTSAKEQIGEALEGRTVRRSFFDTLRALPSSARAWFASTLRFLHLDGAARSAGEGIGWVTSRLMRVARYVRGLGLLSILGAVVTWKRAREAVVDVAAKAYRVVRKPFEWLSRGIKWGFGKIGFKAGVRFIERAEARGERAENWVAGKIRSGLDWMTKHDRHPVMRAARGIFQGSICTRVVRQLFPDAPAWAVYGFSAAVPTIGDQAAKEAAVASEEEAIAKAQEILKDKPAAEQPKGRPTPKRPGKAEVVQAIEPKVVVLKDERDGESTTFEAVGFVGLKGELRIYLSDQLLLEDDLPDGVTVQGEHPDDGSGLVQEAEAKNAAEAKRLEETVRAAQATPHGRPPTIPPRGARRSGGAKKRTPASK